jgi:hypothetical protein
MLSGGGPQVVNNHDLPSFSMSSSASGAGFDHSDASKWIKIAEAMAQANLMGQQQPRQEQEHEHQQQQQGQHLSTSEQHMQHQAVATSAQCLAYLGQVGQQASFAARLAMPNNKAIMDAAAAGRSVLSMPMSASASVGKGEGSMISNDAMAIAWSGVGNPAMQAGGWLLSPPSPLSASLGAPSNGPAENYNKYCHFCQHVKIKRPDSMYACQSDRCSRRFCEHCLNVHLKAMGGAGSPRPGDKDWHCPVCTKTCCCSLPSCGRDHMHCKAHRYRRRKVSDVPAQLNTAQANSKANCGVTSAGVLMASIKTASKAKDEEPPKNKRLFDSPSGPSPRANPPSEPGTGGAEDGQGACRAKTARNSGGRSLESPNARDGSIQSLLADDKEKHEWHAPSFWRSFGAVSIFSGSSSLPRSVDSSARNSESPARQADAALVSWVEGVPGQESAESECLSAEGPSASIAK